MNNPNLLPTKNKVESERKKYLRMVIAATIGTAIVGIIVVIFLFIVLSQEVPMVIPIGENPTPIVSYPLSYPESFPVSY